MVTRNFTGPSFNLFLLILIISTPCLFARIFQQPVVHGNFIFDLFNSSSNLLALAKAWTYVNISAPVQSLIFTCSYTRYLGGYGLTNPYGYIQRTYSPLPCHQSVLYYMTLVSIDHKNIDASFFIQFDDMDPLQWTWSDITADSQVVTGCAGPDNDRLLTISGYVNHTDPSLTVKLSSSLNQTSNNTFGISSFRVLLKNDVLSLSTGVCMNSNGQFKPTLTKCACGNSNFQNSPSQCMNCAYSNLPCYGTTPSRTFTCNVPGTFDGITCTSCADARCYVCESNTTQCSYCLSQYYLYWNYTCITGCNAPYVGSSDGSFNICETPCQYNNTYMFSNNSCISVCAFPLVAEVDGQAMFCTHPCFQTSKPYLNWDGTCVNFCAYYPYTDANGYKYCVACAPGFFAYDNGTCLSTCNPPFVQNFLGGSNFCSSPCPSTSPFYYTDLQVCLTTCTSPYAVVDVVFCVRTTRKCTDSWCSLCQASVSQCSSCISPYYLNWNYVCQASCFAPYINGTSSNSNICSSPCQSNSTFLFTNGTCISTCDPPLSTRAEGQAKFCDYLCSTSMIQYLYWNGSCLSTCPYYTRKDPSGLRYCDACSPGLFSYLNMTCLHTCVPPFIQSSYGGSSFCMSPCPSSANSFYDTDVGLCKPTCTYPYIIFDSVLCVLILSTSEVKQVAAVTAITGAASNISSITTSAVSLASSGNPAAFLMQTTTKMLMSIKYMSVQYPAKLVKIMRVQKTNSGGLPFLSSMYQDFMNTFQAHELPFNFSQYGLYSAFLINFWPSLLTLLILLAVILIIYFSEALLSPKGKLYPLFKSASEIVVWNFSLMYFVTFYGEIILYTSLDLRTSSLNTALPIIEWMVCLLINSIALVIVIKSFYIIIKLQEAKRLAEKDQAPPTIQADVQKLYFRYETVFITYHDTSFLRHACLPISLIRLYAFYLTIAYMFQYPLAQGIIIVALSAGMLLYLIILRPAKEILMMVQYIVQEIFSLMVNVCVLVLVLVEGDDQNSIDTKDKAADVIVLCNTMFAVANSALMCLSLIVDAYVVIKKIYNERKQKKKEVAKLQLGPDVPSKVPTFAKEPIAIKGRLQERFSMRLNFGDQSLEIQPMADRAKIGRDLSERDSAALQQENKISRSIDCSRVEFLRKEADPNSSLF